MPIQPPTKVYLDKSSVHGWGVFAKSKIEKDEIIEECVIIDMGIGKSVSPILIDYRFNWPQFTEDYIQVVATGFSMMYNHNSEANANWRSNLENKTFEFYATKNIEPGEEVFVWYGDVSYWNDGRTHTNII